VCYSDYDGEEYLLSAQLNLHSLSLDCECVCVCLSNSESRKACSLVEESIVFLLEQLENN
jgi:hypothetical protein